MKRWFLLTTLAVAVLLSVACNRGSGCPANEQMQQMGSMSPGEMASMNQKKKKKDVGPKSSVIPAEVMYKGSKKKKKGCPTN